MSSEDGVVDVEEGLGGGEGDVEHTEQRDKPRVHLVPATTSLREGERSTLVLLQTAVETSHSHNYVLHSQPK